MINYSYNRIVYILKNDYNLYLEPLIDYKGNRYGHLTRYNLIDENKNIVIPNITLNGLRVVFERQGYPQRTKD